MIPKTFWENIMWTDDTKVEPFGKFEWAKILFQFLLLKVTQSVIRLKCQLLFRIDTGRFG